MENKNKDKDEKTVEEYGRVGKDIIDILTKNTEHARKRYWTYRYVYKQILIR